MRWPFYHFPSFHFEKMLCEWNTQSQYLFLILYASSLQTEEKAHSEVRMGDFPSVCMSASLLHLPTAHSYNLHLKAAQWSCSAALLATDKLCWCWWGLSDLLVHLTSRSFSRFIFNQLILFLKNWQKVTTSMSCACFAARLVTPGCVSVSVSLYVCVSFCCTYIQSTNSDMYSDKCGLL